MKIDWTALGLVSAVSLVATLAFVVLLSYGVRFVSLAKINPNEGHQGKSTLTVGYAFIGCAALLALFCIYLIVPQLR